MCRPKGHLVKAADLARWVNLVGLDENVVPVVGSIDLPKPSEERSEVRIVHANSVPDEQQCVEPPQSFLDLLCACSA